MWGSSPLSTTVMLRAPLTLRLYAEERNVHLMIIQEGTSKIRKSGRVALLAVDYVLARILSGLTARPIASPRRALPINVCHPGLPRPGTPPGEFVVILAHIVRSMSIYEFTISLHIRHPTIDPCRITEMLAIEPQHMWQAGSPRRGPAGEDREGVYRESYWTARVMEGPQLSSDDVSVETVLMQTVSLLHRAHGFLEHLLLDGGVAELHVSSFVRGNFRLELLAEPLTLLGRLGVAIVLDVHLHTAEHSPRSATT